MDRLKFNWKYLMVLLALCAGFIAIFTALYYFDNKYTATGPQAENGTLHITDETLTETSVLWLVDGWEYYENLLLTPDALENDGIQPDKIVFIGQNMGFELDNDMHNPHGMASYHLNIEIPDEVNTYSLYLPEIFSAYHLYINGQERLQLGNPAAGEYTPATAEKMIQFDAKSKIDIIIAVSDYSYFYSGMVYPPALGTPDGISNTINLRTIFHSGVLAITLILGLITLLVWLFSRSNNLWLYYLATCLMFAGYTAYPVLHLFAGWFYPTYLLEHLCFIGILITVMLLQKRLCGIDNHYSLFFIVFGILTGISSVALQLVLPNASIELLNSYSNLMALYKWLVAFYLTFSLVITIAKGRQLTNAKAMLAGILIFDCAIVMDRILYMYEPIVSGWYIELACFILILIIGGIIAREVYLQYQKNIVLKEQLLLQTEQYQMLSDSIAKTERLRHDFRHHMAVLKEYSDTSNLDALQNYLLQLEPEDALSRQYRYCENRAVNSVILHYAAKATDINFSVDVNIPAKTGIADADLCIVFGNCLENAFEACRRQQTSNRFITVKAVTKGTTLVVTVDNSFDGEYRMKNNSLLSSKRDGLGIGHASVRTTARKYHGNATFEAHQLEFRCSIIMYFN